MLLIAKWISWSHAGFYILHNEAAHATDNLTSNVITSHHNQMPNNY